MTDPTHKIIVLIKQALYEPWIDIVKNGQEPTWLAITSSSSIRVIHYYGRPTGLTVSKLDHYHEILRWRSKKSSLAQRVFDLFVSAPFVFYIPKVEKSQILGSEHLELQCRVPDTFLTMRWKQLSAYRYIIDNFEFDYVYETNASSYINVNGLQTYVNKLDGEAKYLGHRPWPEANFVSGANRLMKRETLQQLVRKRRLWRNDLLEDVAIGRIMRKLRVDITEFKSRSILTTEEINDLSAEDIRLTIHYRMKSGDAEHRQDKYLMMNLHKKIIGKESAI